MKKILGLSLLTLMFTSCGGQPAPKALAEPATAIEGRGASEILSQLSAQGINQLANSYLEAKQAGNEDEFNFVEEVEQLKKQYPEGALETQATYGDIATVVKDLYPAEKAKCDKNGIECALVLQSGGKAHIASATMAGWQTVTVDNERDAIRHSSWNAYMTLAIGYTKAAEWANLHEYGNPNRVPNSLAEQMDLHNNSVGRNIAINPPVTTVPPAYVESVVPSSIKDGIKGGRMKIFSTSRTSLVPSNTYSSRWPASF